MKEIYTERESKRVVSESGSYQTVLFMLKPNCDGYSFKLMH